MEAMADETPRHSVLDDIIAKAIEDAKQQAVRETAAQILASIGDDLEVRSGLRKRIFELLDNDPEIKARLRESVLRALDAPFRRADHRY
jgi:hypothetical protein